ncbi:hypothetical protein ACSX1A_16100 [Pontibacter sp. MBLB2868]|uniref:hypothetical protein n=1 Tax=Pontibacter sp. MBLB2868 TaxID=3451555 RepID=UPI003F753E4C
MLLIVLLLGAFDALPSAMSFNLIRLKFSRCPGRAKAFDMRLPILLCVGAGPYLGVNIEGGK